MTESDISWAVPPKLDIPESSAGGPLSRCSVIELPVIQDYRGNLTFIESHRHIPFNIQRTYYLYDVPGGAYRGGHAHRDLEEFIVAISGSFDVVLADETCSQRVHLNRSYFGLYVGPMVWRHLDNFSSGSVCLVLASAPYDENEYYRDWESYIAALRGDSQ